MAEDKNITPEEKLLNVIQGKADKPAAGPAKDAAEAQKPAVLRPKTSAAPPPAAPAPQKAKAASSSVPPKAAQTAHVPALQPPPRSVEPVDAASRAPAAAVSDKVGDVAEPAHAGPGSAKGNLKPAGANRLDARSRSLAVVNRLLRIAVAVMAGLCVWVIWTSCVAAQKQSGVGAGGAAAQPTRPFAVAPGSCAALLPSFEGKFLFAPPEPQGPGPGTVPTNTPLSEVQEYATRNLNLIGVSPGAGGSFGEAIVMDTQTKRNYFLKVGDKITLKNWGIELRKIASDHAIFQCGKEEIRIQ